MLNNKMKKKYYIAVLVFLGFLLMPTTSFACGDSNKDSCCAKETSVTTKEEKSCCAKEQKTTPKTKKSCCETSKDTNNKDSKGCKGKCGGSKCTCTPASYSFSVILTPVDFLNVTSFYSHKKVAFLYQSPSISDGFSTLWLIPKIG